MAEDKQSPPVKSQNMTSIVVAVIGLIGAVTVAWVTTGAQFDKKFEDISNQVSSLRAELKSAHEAVTAVKERLDSIGLAGALPLEASFDSGWRPIGRRCNTVSLDLPSGGLPRILTAYYRDTVTGEVYPFGINQYGDGNQGNGVLIDVDDQQGKMYLRLPCQNSAVDNSIHLGSYRDRSGTQNVQIVNRVQVEFRVQVWM